MATSRPSSNGRSPLVNQQSQITSFFSKKLSSPSSLLPKSNPSSSPCASPTTPSPLNGKRKTTVPISAVLVDLKPSYGQEVVDKRVKVYWPLDKVWYQGCVKSFDNNSGEHLVKYDDGDEEMIDLGEEKIEWVEAPVRKLRRLRRSFVMEAEEKLEDLEIVEDEEWGSKNAAKQMSEGEDVSEDMDLEIEEKEEEDDDVVGPSSRKGKGSASKVVARKRKTGEGVKLTPSLGKKSKTVADKKSANSKMDSSAVFGVNEKEPVATNEDCK